MLSWLYNSRFNDKLDIWSIFKYMYFHGPSKVYFSFNTWFWSTLPHWYVVNLLPVSLSERLSDTDSSSVPRWDPRINSGEPKFPSLPHSNRGLQSQACQAGLLHFKPGPGIVCLVDHPNSGSVQVIYLFGFMCLVVIWIPCIHGIVCNP